MKLRKIRKNSKALSPVVASIILIAVTVAVSIAVAAWMGALTIGFMDTEELKIVNMEFAAADSIELDVSNIGTSPATVSANVYVNGDPVTITPVTINENTQATLSVPYDWSQGGNYQVRITTTTGNSFTYTAVAPS